ncbi:NB-ARC domain-containing protein [Nocardiopsis protaetiae]|uniref:NB-ARC domain-containing protein n=1 Tax=Nocardiopsis protaetiae TaxID=3382270 RepID=UPI00387B094E
MSTALIIFLATAVALPLLLNEFGEWAPWLAVRIVRWTARRLGHRDDIDRYAEEWEANLNEVPGKLTKLAVAIGMMAYAPRLRGSLKRKRARQVVSSAPSPQPGTFVGREAELEAIAKHFRYRRRGKKASLQVTVLAGEYGVGKTALALACATRLAPSFEGVWWLSPAERADLTPILRTLGVAKEEVPQGQAEQMSMLWKRTANQRILVILDDVGESREENEDLSCLRLTEARCSLLIATRNSKVTSMRMRRKKVFPVRALTRQESFQLLRAQGLTGLSESEIDQLSAMLEDLPLALTQLAVFLRETGQPASEYIRHLEQALKDTEDQPAVDVLRDAWEIVLEDIKNSDPEALALLQLCSLADSASLTRQQLVSVTTSPLPAGLNTAINDPATYRRMLLNIGRRSLAEIDWVEESMHLHRLVRRFIAVGISDTERPIFEKAVSQIKISEGDVE